jgi:hypothetical protein
MSSIEKCAVPTHTLLADYSVDGNYTDCYTTEVRGRISFPEYVFAFYTTLLFRLERLILRITVSKPSTDNEARQLSEGSCETFSAWQVENRRENEVMMCDFVGRTRSWLMAVPVSAVDGHRTRLYFGSAVVPVQNSKTGKPSLGFAYQALLGFHKVYSVLLLSSARLRIQSQMKDKNETQQETHERQ